MRRAILVAFAAACSARPTARPAAPPPPPPAVQVRPAAVGPSIYELPIAMADSKGATISLGVNAGHPTLISMFYGSCVAACPALIGAIGHILDQLPPASRDDVRVLLVSFDPARDTPARLAELVRSHRLDARWTLAAPSELDARTLAAVLGIRYRVVADGEFFHTSAIVTLDRDGREIARMEGLGDPGALIAALGD
jgi:protein SCO1/2